MDKEIETNPSTLQTFTALVKLRTLRLVRDIQKLYFVVLLPLILATLGLYLQSTRSMPSKVKAMNISAETYADFTQLAVHNATNHDIAAFVHTLQDVVKRNVSDFSGNFSSLLEVSPHMAAMNVNVFNYPDVRMTVLYNDTAQHSLPVILNIIDNTFYRYVVIFLDETWSFFTSFLQFFLLMEHVMVRCMPSGFSITFLHLTSLTYLSRHLSSKMSPPFFKGSSFTQNFLPKCYILYFMSSEKQTKQ